MNEDEALPPDDAVKILEELLEAQNQSFVLGLRLNLRVHEVEAIHLKYLDPRDRLLHVIIAFLNQVEPRPTWRVIVDALKTRTVNLPRLAAAVERAHFPDPNAIRAPPPPPPPPPAGELQKSVAFCPQWTSKAESI